MLKAGGRVRLAVDLRLAGEVVPAAGPGAETGAGAGFLALAAGTGGTVERVDEDRPRSREVREYERLKSLLDDFGHQLPPASGRQLEEQVAALEPAWAAYLERKLRTTVRVRLDNGFVLDDAPGDLFTPA
ncbi:MULTISPECIES: hypothetical protein [unclassified Streptomyces]|uniref:hypothetical protein n=1 Tax=unclassified Streptomyces TaxID=2593676 RepID=UPI0006AE90B2|nr:MULTISPECIES: hypothetical protein [unclassified Streptomyces]KOX25591.1 hypothetical protein ADL06_18855 [Streptomyces sp. NRRL F-6491]KOX48935.1 hypothetical protein ADL08_09575 [Streptomyces sp. NRRL F-6492]